MIKSVKYSYNSIKIGGGGFVTGCIFHPRQKNVLYARTDVGGIYRRDYGKNVWKCLSTDSEHRHSPLMQPLALAVDEEKPQMLYALCGNSNEADGFLAVSDNYGESFELKPVPFAVNGNCRGRSTGERLLYKNGRLFAGSVCQGAFVSSDGGDSWTALNINGEKCTTFISCVNNYILLGTDGAVNSDGSVRGNTLYYSGNFGLTFEPLALPENAVPLRCAANNDFLFVSVNYCNNGQAYGCEFGRIEEGGLLRFKLTTDGFENLTDITPQMHSGFGGGGVDVAESLVIASFTGDNRIFVSENSGSTWREIINRHDSEKYVCNAEYLLPKYNDGVTAIHWMTDIKIDPFNRDFAIFNTGTGFFAIDKPFDSEKPMWYDWNFGLEETVHMNIYAPPKSSVKLLDAVGDLGGFAFTDVDNECEKLFTNEKNMRYITVLNMDYSDSENPLIIATPRGNWNKTSKGGLIISNDNANTWRRAAMPYGISSELDEACSKIERPNVNSGWCALSADESTIVWTLASGRFLPSSLAVYSDDCGKSWRKCSIDNKCEMLKVMSDRVNARLFYGFSEHGRVFISKNGGKCFKEYASLLPDVQFGICEGFDCEIRCEYEKEGVIWISLDKYGLWRLQYDIENDTLNFKRINRGNDAVYAHGMGKGLNSDCHALFIAGEVDGEYGFWRSYDEGASWVKINSKSTMFGRIRTICGDYNVLGRIYIGTGGYGLLYGDEI